MVRPSALLSCMYVYARTHAHLPDCLPTYLPAYKPTYLPTCLLAYLPIFLYTSLPIYLYIYIPISLSLYIYIYIYRSVYLSVYLPMYIPICIDRCIDRYIDRPEPRRPRESGTPPTSSELIRTGQDRGQGRDLPCSLHLLPSVLVQPMYPGVHLMHLM